MKIRNRVTILLFLALISLFIIVYDNGNIFYNLLSDWKLILISVFCIGFICYVVFDIKPIKRKIVFDKNEIIVTGRTLKIKVSQKKYPYSNIQKILVGRFYNKLNPEKNIYSFFIDNEEQIIKFCTTRAYKECHELMKLIKEKTGRKIYDDTDTSYMSEDDFIRSYYKLTKMMAEVKGE